MSASHGKTVFISRIIRKLRGGSQPALVRGSDGFLYVVKFANNPQGPGVLFNESIGSELYRAAGLPVPDWKPLLVTQEFLDTNRRCWIETETETICPKADWCFGSQFVGDAVERIWEILPGSFQNRVRNLSDFWLAWLIDSCAGHTDNRQAIFRGDSSMTAIFIDHGHLFGGPAEYVDAHAAASRYLDARIYDNAARGTAQTLYSKVATINIDRLVSKLQSLPDSWKTDASLQRIAQCLNNLSDSSFLRKTLWSMEDSHARSAPGFIHDRHGNS
jgi:HipA-like kinase